jgi:hypothetical protein
MILNISSQNREDEPFRLFNEWFESGDGDGWMALIVCTERNGKERITFLKLCSKDTPIFKISTDMKDKNDYECQSC